MEIEPFFWGCLKIRESVKRNLHMHWAPLGKKKKCSFLARYSLAPCKKQKKAHTRVYTPRLSFSTFRLLSEKKKRKSKPALVHRTISNYQFQTSRDVWNQDHFSIWNFQGRQRLTCWLFSKFPSFKLLFRPIFVLVGSMCSEQIPIQIHTIKTVLQNIVVGKIIFTWFFAHVHKLCTEI